MQSNNLNEDDQLGIAEAVECIMSEHFPGGMLASPTDAAIFRGRCRVRMPDANDNTPDDDAEEDVA